MGTGFGDPVYTIKKGGEEGDKVTDRSTHRFDRNRIESRPKGFEFRSKNMMDLNKEPEVSELGLNEEISVEEQKERWEELAREGKERQAKEREDALKEGGAGPGVDEYSADLEGEEEEIEGTREEDNEELWVDGEKKFRRSGWAIGRLDVDDNAACVARYRCAILVQWAIYQTEARQRRRVRWFS